MAVSPTPLSSADGRFSQTRWLLVVGVLSALCYAATYWAQRAIYLNGLYASIGGALLFGASRDAQRLYLELGVYAASSLGLFVLYGLMLGRCDRGLIQSPWARRLALAIPVIFNLVFLFGRPYFSIDVYTYIVHGYIATLPDGNPYQMPASAAIDAQFGRDIVPWGWRPVHGVSPYGPLWTHIETLVLRLTDEVSPALLLLKVVIVTASLASAALIWMILGHVRPQDQLLGTVAYLWNPVVVIEFASEGHNDALMVVFVLLGLLLTVRLWRALGVGALLLGVLSKFIPLIFLPAHLVFLWHRRRSWWHFALHALLGIALGVGIAALLYQPFWIGMDTLQGVREQGRPTFYASMLVPLMMIFALSREFDTAAQMSFYIMGAIFAVFAFVRSILVRDEMTLIRACASIALAYLLLFSPTYWPWYTTLPIALMALTPHGTFRWMLVVLAVGARATGPLDDVAVNGHMNTILGYAPPEGAWSIEVWATTIVALMIPLLLVLILSARRGIIWLAAQRRTTATTDAST